MTSDSAAPAAPDVPPTVLEARGLQRHFGAVKAVDHVNLSVREGEIYGFLGVNGAGKTTTIRLLMGIIAGQAGTIMLMGETSKRTTVRQKRRIGYVSQEQNFYPWMTCQQLGRFVGSMYPTWDKAEFKRLLDVFEIPASRRVSQLSGGMKAKLGLALALAPRPDLLILDEPTAGLDPVARREFMQIIVAQARQHRRTTFFSSHLIDEVERCADRVGILHGGRMRFEGGLDDLRSQVRRVVLPGEVLVEMPPEFECWREEPVDGCTTLTLRAEPDLIFGLLEKEIRQSRLALFMMLLFMGAGLWAILRSPMVMRMGGSAFDAGRMLLFVFMPLACVVLAQPVVAGEFRQRSQLFLEGLPLPRWRMLAVKYVLGLGMVWLVTLSIGVAAWWHTQGGEALTPRFIQLMAVKAMAWSAFCWSVCYALGFLGRYRMIVMLTLVISLVVLQAESGVVSRFGPFDLMGTRFAFERYVWPEKALWITGSLVAGTTALGFVLGLMRDASVATMLAERMSAREKVTIGIIAIMALMSVGFVQERKRDAGPVYLPGSLDVTKGAATVSVAAAVETLTEEEKQAVDACAHQMADMLGEMAEWLHCERLPPLFLVHRRDFDAEQTEEGGLDSRQGFMLRLNLTKGRIDDGKLREQIVWMMLRVYHHYRLPSDDAGWVLDGFAHWWPHRADEASLLAQSKDRKVSVIDLQRWLKVRADLGDTAAREYAASGIVALGKACGEDKRRAFIAAVLGPPTSHDVRGTIREALHPAPKVLTQTTGLTLEQLAEAWAHALKSNAEVKP
jgi:ABC-2 type transport system ATP-binding protein